MPVIVALLIVGSVVAAPWILTRSAPLIGKQSSHGGAGSNLDTNSSAIFPTLQDLTRNSTIVVVATIGDVAATFNYTDGAHVDTFYVFNLSITNYVKGTGRSTILYSPGAGGGSIPPVKGQEYVLFLRSLTRYQSCNPNYDSKCIYPPTPPELTFIATGGSQGKFLVQNGLVYGMKTLYPQWNDYVAVDANGVPLSSFIAQISAVSP